MKVSSDGNHSIKNPWYHDPKLSMIIVLIVSVVTLFPVLNNDWVNWDDPAYVTQNGIIRDLSYEGVLKMFDPENRVLDTYTPLTMISFSIDYAFHQNDAEAYHATNLLIHILNVFLVFIFIYQLTKQNFWALFTALFFAIHPMHVESVAWVSERKDLLFSFFFLASCIQYLMYLRKQQAYMKWKSFNYIFAIILGLLSILAKPQAVALPLVFLLINYWETKKISIQDFYKLIPFVLLSIFFGFVALNIMNENSSEYGFVDQLLLSGHACFLYLIKAIFPYDLNHNPGIPLPEELPFYYFITTIISVIILLAGVWFGRRKRIIVFGVGFFVFTLIFSLHLLKINSGIAYERFTYLPYIGLFLIAAFYIDRIISANPKLKMSIYFSLSFLLLMFAYTSNQRSRDWKNDEALWTNSLEIDSTDAMAYCKRARYYTSVGLMEIALNDQQKCLELSEDKVDALVNRGNIYMRVGELNAALLDYSEAIQIMPDYALPYSCRGILLISIGNYKAGLSDLKKSVELDSTTSSYFINLGLAYELENNNEEAINFYSRAIEIDPYDYNAWKYRGSLHRIIGNVIESISDLERALHLKPDFKEAWYEISKTNYKRNKLILAHKQLERAIELGANVEEDYKRRLGL